MKRIKLTTTPFCLILTTILAIFTACDKIPDDIDIGDDTQQTTQSSSSGGGECSTDIMCQAIRCSSNTCFEDFISQANCTPIDLAKFTSSCNDQPSSSSGGTVGKAEYCGYGADCPPNAHCEQSPKKCYRFDNPANLYPGCPTGAIWSGQFAGTFASEEECIANGFPVSDMCIPAVTCTKAPCTPEPIPCSDLPSSSSGSVIEGEMITYQGQTYKTVKIGNQTWMAENLNYGVPGSECYQIFVSCPHGESCPALASYCKPEYGMLYDWATAMKVDSRFNNASYIAATATNCASDGSAATNCVPANPYHQGICPGGWHIPKKQEWEELFNFADNTPSCNGIPADMCHAGVHLKAVDGWDLLIERELPSGLPFVGKDTYGFAALPGGIWASSYGTADIIGFFDVGKHGYWWSATEETGLQDRFAINSTMSYSSGQAGFGFAGFPAGSSKDSKMSVRCVKD